MPDFLYPYVVIGLLLSVVWWFYRVYRDPQNSTILPTLSFWGATVVYASVLYFTKFSVLYKLLLMLPRDFIAVVVVGLLANNLKSTRGYFITAVGVGVGGYFLYSNFIPQATQKYFGNNLPFMQEDTRRNRLAPNGELLFDIKNPAQLALIEAAVKPLGGQIRQAFSDIKHLDYSDLEEYYVLDIPENTDLEKVIKTLEATGAIDWVEQNEVISLSPLESNAQTARPNRKDYGINDPHLGKMWAFEAMNVSEYYNYLKTNGLKPQKKAKIAILDTGVDSEHEDIKGNYKSTKKKYDRDKQSHGTHCAGIASAVSNNGLGIASLNMNGEFTEITSIKVLSDQGWGTQDQIIQGIIEAADNGADVISMSLGGPSTDAGQRAYEEAIRYANQAGAIVVVAAGNSNENAIHHSPANCKGVITVSAIDQNLARADFSNFVNDVAMGIAAPGVEIFSTIPKNQYAAYSGTSMATPYTAGILGVMKAFKPALTTQEAYKILTKTGVDTKDTPKTGKLINPFQAIKSLQ
ncbi:MAG: S8 family serine peptidase [Microscillaceae bacterium]|jgi:thermitase|nr:S8 family serine peptidase [Microscillaceae bacterium]